ncbi:hypothetical protein J6590_054391 [Homalodisca vitripennis]|nr:hypothetical protein J6590_054391 [Homalodisca vitripennis]
MYSDQRTSKWEISHTTVLGATLPLPAILRPEVKPVTGMTSLCRKWPVDYGLPSIHLRGPAVACDMGTPSPAPLSLTRRPPLRPAFTPNPRVLLAVNRPRLLNWSPIPEQCQTCHFAQPGDIRHNSGRKQEDEHGQGNCQDPSQALCRKDASLWYTVTWARCISPCPVTHEGSGCVTPAGLQDQDPTCHSTASPYPVRRTEQSPGPRDQSGFDSSFQ